MASSGVPRMLYVLPLLAVVVLGVSTFLGLGSAPVRSALVLGGPTDTGGPFRGRLQVREETGDLVVSVAGAAVHLHARRGNHEVRRRYRSDDSGWVEFEIPAGPAGQVSLRITDDQGGVLAKGSPRLDVERWAASARRRGGRAKKQESGGLSAKLEVEQRIVAVPFRTPVRLLLEYEGRPASGAEVVLTGTGTAIIDPPRGSADEDGVFAFAIEPNQHAVSVRAEIRHEGERLDFEQNLPVVPGAFGLSRSEQTLTILSPVPRESVWYTFVRRDERLEGGRLDLSEEPSGISRGALPLADVPPIDGLYLVLGSEADGRSPSTVGYPLDGQATTFDAWDAYLLDGGPAAKAKAEARRRKVRWTLGAYTGLSGLLTLIVFVAHVRRSDRRLAERLEGAGANEQVREKSLWPLLTAVVCLFFAFSAGVLWIVAR